MMKNFYWKALSLASLCAFLLVICAADVGAYPTYETSGGAGGNCSQCHYPDQDSWRFHNANSPQHFEEAELSKPGGQGRY